MPLMSVASLDLSLVGEAVRQLHEYLQVHDYAGHDPYDGLESRVFRATPLKKLKVARLAWIQLMKRSPINLRPLLLVPRGRNPKGIALGISALLELSQVWGDLRYVDEARGLLSWLISHQTKDRQYNGCSWGYNFDWQSRAFFAPKGAPNMICTVFAANAFLDAYEITSDQTYLDIARSSCTFAVESLLRSEGDNMWFSYTPLDNVQVHNANLLGAALLARVHRHTGEKKFRQIARDSVRFSIDRQNDDGSWYYGEAVNQRWIDNFHTGYNLVALKRYQGYAKDLNVEKELCRGYEFFDRHFFHDDGMPNYYHDRLYPIDAHCSAQGILTYLEFQKYDSKALEKAIKIAEWAIRYMYSDKGYFYYQKHRFYTIKISYIRWAQAWMFYALSRLLNTPRTTD